MSTWLYYEKLDNWHLQEEEVTVELEEETVITYATWCGLELNKDVPRKEANELSQWGDALHDECLRRSETR